MPRIVKTFKKTIGKTTHCFELSVNCDNRLIHHGFSTSIAYGYTDAIASLKVDHIENITPVFSMNKVDGEYPTHTFTNTHTNTDQCWSLMFGLKYSF